MKVVVYTKMNCPQCVKVKRELDLKGVLYEEVRVDLVPESRQFLIDSGHKSVPQVYINGVHTDPSTII